MIEDFYNREFTAPTLDSRTEMSQDEGKFMQITDGQFSLRTGTIKSLSLCTQQQGLGLEARHLVEEKAGGRPEIVPRL